MRPPVILLIVLLLARSDRLGAAERLLGDVRDTAETAQDVDPASDPNTQPFAGTPVSGYILCWSDEFSGNAVDTNKWNFRTGVRYWSVQQPQNNIVSNGLYGCLLKKETVGASQYTAGGLISTALFRYGYYETRMKVPPGAGWHSSFWLMKQTLDSNDVAQVELDALENDSVTPTQYGINNHRWRPLPIYHFGGKTVTTPSLAADFHVIGCEYTDTTVKYFFDGALEQTVATTNFTPADVNIWLTSIAAPLGGTTHVDDAQLPAMALYDYARFFVREPTGSVNIASPASGVTLADTNQTLRVTATATTSDARYPPAVTWSKVSGPGQAAFADAAQADTTVRFSAPGSYLLHCRCVVLNDTNTAPLGVGVNAPVTLALREGVNGYGHCGTFVRGDSVNWNSGARDQLIVGRWGGQPLRPVFSFGLAPLGDAPNILSLTLVLWTSATAGTGAVGELELRPLLGTPAEGTGDGSSAANGAGTGATWVSRTGGATAAELWSHAGGDFATNRLSAVPGYDATWTGVQKTFPSSPALVSLAQSAAQSGQPLNLLLLSPATEAGANNFISRFGSDDYGIPEQRPCLTLTFIGNFAPAVATSDAITAMVGVEAALPGAVSNALGCAWSAQSGPAAVTFGNGSQPVTTASFAQSGSYVLRLTASNALAQVSRDLAVQVSAFTRPQASIGALAHGQARLQVSGAAGLNYTVQASTNLTTWDTLFTTNTSTMPFSWADPGAASYPARFYRVLLGP